ARVTVVTAMPNRRIPGRGEGEIDPRYRGKLFLEEDWQGIRTLRSWLYTGDGRGFVTKMVNNATFMMTGMLHALAKREKFDVIIASSPPFLPHVSGAMLSRLRNVPLVLEIRDLWPDYMVAFGMLSNERSRRALFGLERWLLAQADRTVVVTDSFKTRIIDKGVPAGLIDVIPNGVKLDDYFRCDEPAPIATMSNDGDFIVGYLGTFGRGQGLASVVRTAAELEKTYPEIKFILAGDGPDKPAVEAEIAASGARNVILHPPILRDQTRAFYNACDVCLVPLAPIAIFNETVPSKLFEVMACERPLVASVSGEGAKIVNESGGGIVSPPGDAAGLAAAILQVRHMSAPEREAMGARARRYVAENYNRTTLADQYFEILTRLASQPRRARRAHE
ncbi:MAG: glycosyltransferase family 4 protein, partial [Gemmatimonadota bacterium]|nr:glycosyltransferase family 4 protein [Gemmatimonadota bacterium]